MKNKLRLWLFILTCTACGGHRESEPEEAPDSWSAKLPPIANEATPLASSLECESGTKLSYENFGAGFLATYCTSCHSSQLDAPARAGAPAGADFETGTDIQFWRVDSLERVSATGSTKMPPGRTIDAHALARFKEWMQCGAPGNF